jgi:uncharacterized membrane protein
MDEDYSAKKQVSITKALDDSWGLMWKNFVSILLLSIAFLLIAGLFTYIVGLSTSYFPSSLFDSALNLTTSTIISIIMTIAIANTTLKLADNQKIVFADLFSRISLFFHVLIAQIIYVIAVIAGLIFLIVPGILFALRFSLYDLYIIDRGCGPIEALEKSWKTLKGYTWRWLGFYILCFLINVLGLLCFIVGLLFTLPTTAIARALLYRRLTNLEPEILP